MLVLFEWAAAFITWFLVRVQPYWKRIEPFLRLFILIIVTLIVTFWVAVFSYLILYYFYVPIAKVRHPLNFKFSSDCKLAGEFTGVACSFPQDNITLETDGKSFLSFGQSYKVFVNIEVPESEINRKIGMFMVGMKMYGKKNNILEEIQHPIMLNYKSPLLETIETLVFSPLYIFGSKTQSQTLNIEMFTNLIDNPYDHIKFCTVSIYTELLQYYSGNIELYANFSGLRSFMFFYPVFSAVCFVTAFFLCLNFIVLINWLHRQWVKMDSDKIAQQPNKNFNSDHKNVSDNSEDDWPEPRPINISGHKVVQSKKENIENVGPSSSGLQNDDDDDAKNK